MADVTAAESGDSAGFQQPITIHVKAQDNAQTSFKVKMATPMKKLMDSYVQRMGVSRNDVRFTYDGSRVMDTDTPKTLDMDDGDLIDVFIEMKGGGRIRPWAPPV